MMQQFNANSGRLSWLENIRKERQAVKGLYPTPLHLFRQRGLGRRGVIVKFKDRGCDLMWEERGNEKNANYTTILNYYTEDKLNLISYMREKYPLQIRVTYHGQKRVGTVTQITKEHVCVEFDKGGEEQIEMLDFFAFGRRVDNFFPYGGNPKIRPRNSEFQPQFMFRPLIVICDVSGVRSIEGE
jgi:hypothetical protein